MHDVVLVGKGQGAAHLPRDVYHIRLAQGLLHDPAQGWRIHELHHDVQTVVGTPTKLVDVDNAVVISQQRPDFVALLDELVHQIGIGLL